MTLDAGPPDAPDNPLPGRGHDIVVVGASAGGVEALRALAASLPPDLPAAVLVVLHVARNAPSVLPSILDRAGPLPARHVLDGELLRYGRIFVAPANHHLLVLDGRVRLSPGPSENGHRPAVDPLFRSAARAYGPRVVGVVLSGARDDGAAGLAVVGERGGVTVVQDPAEALYPSMPKAAMTHTRVDHVLPVAKIGSMLGELSRRTTGALDQADDAVLDAEVAMAQTKPVTSDEIAEPSEFACPSCGGALFRMPSATLPRFRCRVGHAWSPQSLLEEQGTAAETALWMALRALEEKADLTRRLADTSQRAGAARAARQYQASAQQADWAGTLIRDLIRRIDGGSGEAGEE